MEISNEEVLKTISQKEFGNNVINSADTVIIVMTQDWCPQWHAMKGWIYKFEDENTKVYEIAYNNKEYFREFMSFKENIFQNNLVPYIRIYKQGKFFKACNYRSEKMFESFLNMPNE